MADPSTTSGPAAKPILLITGATGYASGKRGWPTFNWAWQLHPIHGPIFSSMIKTLCRQAAATDARSG